MQTENAEVHYARALRAIAMRFGQGQEGGREQWKGGEGEVGGGRGGGREKAGGEGRGRRAE